MFRLVVSKLEDGDTQKDPVRRFDVYILGREETGLGEDEGERRNGRCDE